MNEGRKEGTEQGMLKGKHLILELADWTRLVKAKGHNCLSQATDHGGRTTQEDLDIGTGLGEPFLCKWWSVFFFFFSFFFFLFPGFLLVCFLEVAKAERDLLGEIKTPPPFPLLLPKKKGFAYLHHFSSNKAHATCPTVRGFIQHVVDAEAAVCGGKPVKVLSEENVLAGDVGKDEVHLGLVALGPAADDGADQLQHWGDSGAAGDHAEVTDHVWGVDKGALGASHLDGLPDGQRRHVLADVSRRVRLDEQVEVPGLVVPRDGRVGAYNLLLGPVRLAQRGADRDVLADGEAEDGSRRRQREAVDGHVVRDYRLLLQLKLLELCRLECLLWFYYLGIPRIHICV